MRHAVSAAIVGALTTACGAQVAPQPSGLHAQLAGLEGEAHGRVELSLANSGRALLKVEVVDLPPGAHGFHIHETGDCNPADGFSAAGGHLSGGASHGVKSEGGMHVGDLPNLFIPDSGALRAEHFLDEVMIASGPAPLMDMDGASVVIHAIADDYESQPSGAAGARIACGVLERAPG